MSSKAPNPGLSSPLTSISVNPDVADLEAAPYTAPVVFDRLRVPCQCGGTLVGEEYEFFPSTLAIKGTCVKCGPRRAIFAPPLDETSQQKDQRLAEEMTLLNEEETTILNEFLEFVRRTDAA